MNPILPSLNRYARHLALLVAICCCLAAGSGFAQTPPVFTGGSVLPDGRGLFHLQVQPDTEHSFLISTNLRDWSTVFVFASTESAMTVTSDVPLVDLGPSMFFRAATGRVLNFDLRFQFQIQGGSFGGGTTASVSYPVSIGDYLAVLDVGFDTLPAAPAEVTFTGPAGSGLSGAAAVALYDGGEEFTYASPQVTSPVEPPAGSWTVEYRDRTVNFTPPPPQGAAHLALPVPVVTVSAGLLYRVDWTYRNSTNGATLGAPPPFMSNVQVQVDGDDGSGWIGRLYDSEELSPSVTSHVMEDLIIWDDVRHVALAYDDTLGNHFVVFYQKP